MKLEEKQKFEQMVQFALSQEEPIHAVALTDFCKLLDSYNALEKMNTEQAARIAELEDKLRWRDCKTEPPKETGYYLARWNHERLPEVSGVFFNSGMRHGWRVLHLTRQPDSWRPIE